MNEKPPILGNFPLSAPQLAAALARDSDVAVTAGAGTGKTRTLVARFLALLADGLPLRQIVAVTFTRKAAREMRNRVRQEIGTYLSSPGLNVEEKQAWQVYYNELDAARIGTIHNLCAEILRTHPAEIGIDPRFIVLDETQSALLAIEARESALAWAVNADSAAPLFDLLSEQQLQDLIATLLKKRLAVSQLIGEHAAETILVHWQSKLQEFQEEAVERLLANEAFIAAKRTLRQNQADNSTDKAEVQRHLVLDALATLVNESLAGKLRNISALDGIRLGVGSQKSWPGGKEQLSEVKEALKRLREMYRAEPLLKKTLNEQDERIAAAMPAVYALWQQAHAAYQRLKEEREGLDFDDLEALAIQLLENHTAVRHYWQSQVQALLVDEFQDTNEQQCHLIRLLCPDPGKLFIVGDAKQSIYRFRGADVTVFAREKEEIGRQGGVLIDLDTSYRAHEPLLVGMNNLLRPVLGDDAAGRRSWVAPFTPLEPGTKAVAQDLRPPYIEFHLTLGTKPEAMPRSAEALAERLARLNADGLDFGEMAILCRASGSFQYYENAFDAIGIPYLTVAGKGFYDRPEIRDLLNALQAVADPHDDIALTGLLRSPACEMSDVALYRLAQGRAADRTLWDTVQTDVSLVDPLETSRLQAAILLVRDLNQQVGRISVADLLKQFLVRTYYRAILRRAGQPRALRNVAKLLNDIHNSGLVSVDDFLAYAQTLRSSGTREGEARATSGGAVQIMSIHAAKGLEFPVIVLGDVSSGGSGGNGIAVDPQAGILFPYKHDGEVRATSYVMWAALDKLQNEAETARLLYVALTRAEQMLLINGYIQQNKSGTRSWKGWLDALADITGLKDADLSAYDETGSGQHTFDFSVEGSAVRAAIYEPEYTVQKSSPADETEEPAAERPSAAALQDPIIKETAGGTAGGETPQRIWQVVPATKRPTAPAWVIGSLVHEALSLWRFPSAAGFDAWIAARARGYGITDQQQLHDAQIATARLLTRFQRSELYQAMDNAPRRLHEVPYSCQVNGKAETGYIDALFRTNDVWTVVDFKTDRIQDDAAYQRSLIENDYIAQLQQYGRAVEQLLGVVPQLTLCLLNYAGAIRVIPVAR